MNPPKAKKPRQGRIMEKRSFSLHPAQWAKLKAVERETGAKPSTTVQRLIDRNLGHSAPSS